MSEETKLKISHFTDPMCFWCYAMEPEVRKIRMLLGEQLDYRIVMGVLSSEVHEFVGDDELSQVRYETFRNQLANYLISAAEQVGMPMSPEYMQTCSPEELVSKPLSRAYCAMKMTDEDTAEAFLRRMRECIFAEGRSLLGTDKLVELAREFPIDAELFRENLESGVADSVLQEGVDECWAYNVTAFPSLLMEYGENRIMVQGYRNYAELRNAIVRVTDGAIELGAAQYSLDALEAYMQRFGKAAAREIQIMFSLSEEQLNDAMMDLVGTGLYTAKSCGSSYFAVPK